jgi:hypothetical protein
MSSQRTPPDSRERPEPARRAATRDPLRQSDSGRRGNLLLISTDHLPAQGHSTASAADLTHVQLRAAYDAALEEIAFLQEQLRGLEAYSAHVYELERARLADERDALRLELERLGESGGSPIAEPVAKPNRLHPFAAPRRGYPTRGT